MAMLTQAEIQGYATNVVDQFKDGIQAKDFFVIVPMVMEIIGKVKTMTNEEKKGTVVLIVNRAIDMWDIPWIPDSIVDPVLKSLVPHLIEGMWDVYVGKYKFAPELSTTRAVAPTPTKPKE